MLNFIQQTSDNVFVNILFMLPIVFWLLYAQKIAAWNALRDVSGHLTRLKGMRERARKEALDYVASTFKSQTDPTTKVDQFLEYFTIFPVDLDPAGIVRKIEHLMTLRDERMRAEIRKLAPDADKVQMTTAENVFEVATALNMIYKIVRHLYLLSKKTKSYFVIIQLQMIMPLVMQEAEALANAMDSIKLSQPLGDGIGASIVGKMMLGKEKRTIAKDTLICESEYSGRKLLLIKAEGPGGTVGEPGTALEEVASKMGAQVASIIMIDAALKLEGEETGSVAEGIGAAIGGIGVDRFKIEEVAAHHKIPLYAVVIKQSILEAITAMRKEIAETVDRVTETVHRIIEEKTKPGETVIVVGVGNTLGIGQ